MAADEHAAVAGIQHALAQNNAGGPARFESVRIDDGTLLPLRRVHPAPVKAKREIAELPIGPEMAAAPVVFQEAVVNGPVQRRTHCVLYRFTAFGTVPAAQIVAVEQRLPAFG